MGSAARVTEPEALKNEVSRLHDMLPGARGSLALVALPVATERSPQSQTDNVTGLGPWKSVEKRVQSPGVLGHGGWDSCTSGLG